MQGITNATIEIKDKIEYVNWIESTGIQYIDTGISANSNIDIILDIQLLSEESQYLCGSRVAFQNNALGISKQNDDGGTEADISIRWAFGSEEYNMSDINNDSLKNRSIVSIKNKQAIFKENIQNTFTNDFNNSLNIFLFTTNDNGTAHAQCAKMKLYGAKIYENNILVRNFFPCKDPMNIFCLYDAVSKQYFYNIGAGYFEGPNPTQVEYLESTGTQYIDTGVVMTESIRTEFDFELSSVITGSSVGIVGGWGDPYQCGMIFGMNSGAFRFAYGGPWNGKTQAADLNRHIVQINKDGQCLLDTTVLATSSDVVTSITSTKNTYIFTSSGGTSTPPLVRIFYCKFYENDILIRDFIPVYIGTYCLYDKINKKYYYNQGTEDFLGGVDIKLAEVG